MNSIEYLDILEKKLRHLPKSDREEALTYYKEYIADAGVENEDKIIEELGSPDKLADSIIISCAVKSCDNTIGSEAAGEDYGVVGESYEAPKKKHQISTVWLVLLAICALPFSPVVLALALVVFVMVLCAIVVIGSLIVAGVAIGIGGAVAAVFGIVLVFSHLGSGLMALGSGLLLEAVGIFVLVAFIKLWQLFFKWIIGCGRKTIKKKNQEV